MSLRHRTATIRALTALPALSAKHTGRRRRTDMQGLDFFSYKLRSSMGLAQRFTHRGLVIRGHPTIHLSRPRVKRTITPTLFILAHHQQNMGEAVPQTTQSPA